MRKKHNPETAGGGSRSKPLQKNTIAHLIRDNAQFRREAYEKLKTQKKCTPNIECMAL